MSKRKALSSNNRTYLAMTIPIVILFFLFNTLPLITGAIYSFTNYRGYGTFDFVGLRNYIDLFSDERVLHSYLFTFKYAIAGTILINCLSLLLAMGLNSRIRCKSLAPRRVLCPEYSGRTDRRLYFQLYLYLHHSGCWQGNAHRLSGKQYSCQ